MCKYGPEAPSCPVGQGSFKMDCFKVEKCSMVKQVQIWHSCWSALRPKEGGELPACYQHSVQKPASTDGMGANAKSHTAAITTAWLCRRVRVLNWPACSPDLKPIEYIWRIIIWKIRQRRPQTLQRLEIYTRQKWDQIPLPKLQKFITSMPRHLQTVLKRRRDATPS